MPRPIRILLVRQLLARAPLINHVSKLASEPLLRPPPPLLLLRFRLVLFTLFALRLALNPYVCACPSMTAWLALVEEQPLKWTSRFEHPRLTAIQLAAAACLTTLRCLHSSLRLGGSSAERINTRPLLARYWLMCS